MKPPFTAREVWERVLCQALNAVWLVRSSSRSDQCNLRSSTCATVLSQKLRARCSCAVLICADLLIWFHSQSPRARTAPMHQTEPIPTTLTTRSTMRTALMKIAARKQLRMTCDISIFTSIRYSNGHNYYCCHYCIITASEIKFKIYM